jgi:hypothetical protein
MNKDHVISDEAFDNILAELSIHKHWLAYNAKSYYLEKGDMRMFYHKDEADEFAGKKMSSDNNYKVVQVDSIIDVMRKIPYELKHLTDPDSNGLHNKDGNALTDALIDHFEKQQLKNGSKTNRKDAPFDEQYFIPPNILRDFDLAGLMDKMHKADWHHAYSDDPDVFKRGCQEIQHIKEELLNLTKLEQGISVANRMWETYVPIHSVSKPDFLEKYIQSISIIPNNTTMNENNYDYLNKQIKFTGFGEGHQEKLKENLQKQTPEFTIFHQQDFGKDNVVATLQFKKSEDSDMYFFNRYNLMLKNQQHTDPLKQTFYINNKEDNITLKEAYNMMSGRAVHKELTNKEGEKYNAWLQLDFKTIDKHGNYEVKKFHQNYGFDLEKTLAKYPIKELSVESDKPRLMESLHRGNRQGVTFQHDGREQKVFIEASPQFKSLNFYDGNMKRVNAHTLYEKQGEGQTEKQEAKKETVKQDKAGDDEPEIGAQKQSAKKGRKKRQGIS